MSHMTSDLKADRSERVLITGASSGIGLAAAEQLAPGGAEVIMVSRDRARGEAAREKVAAVASGRTPTFCAADLSSQSSIRELAARLHDRFESIDVLINNPGTASRRRELTVDGLEKTFATNHLAPFLLTHLLIDLLLAAPAGRIVTTTSGSHSRRLDFENLQGERGYNFFSAYARSKLANILFTYELARRLAVSRVTANCATNFGRGGGGAMGLMSALVHVFGRSAESGARTAVYLATSPEVDTATGLYLFHGKPARSKPITVPPRGRRTPLVGQRTADPSQQGSHPTGSGGCQMKPTRGINLGPRARRVVRLFARFINPLTLLIAGRRWMPILGVIRHQGRRSGRMYATPLGMRPFGSSFVMPRTFGKNAAWYLNVQAAGWCVVTYRGRDYTLIEPEVIGYATAAPAFPRYELLQFRLVGISEYLRMRQVPAGWPQSTSDAPALARA